MIDQFFFNKLVTKSLHPIAGNDRFFEGYLTVEVKDKQGEVTIVDELIKVLPIWMDRGAPITDTHSNRVIGKGINYQKTIYKSEDGEEYPAIKIIGKIHSNYELDAEIWNRIKSGEYKGLSFGGATKSNRTPFRMKDGSIAYSLKDLEHYEVAVCKDPAVPLALITDFNQLAKAATDGEELPNNKMLIKCSKWGCYVEKGNFDAKTGKINTEEIMNKDPSSDETQVHITSDGEVVGTGGNKTLQDIQANQKKQNYKRKDEDDEDGNDDDYVTKVDLGSYATFQDKVDALIAEGKTEEEAKNIVGAFVKGEKKAADLGAEKPVKVGKDVHTLNNEESQQITKRYKEDTNYINLLIKTLVRTW